VSSPYGLASSHTISGRRSWQIRSRSFRPGNLRTAGNGQYAFAIETGATSAGANKSVTIKRSSNSSASSAGGKSPAYAEWTKEDLLKRAREIGIDGRSKMSKAQLVKALRDY
jgi:hypothetical protein